MEGAALRPYRNQQSDRSEVIKVMVMVMVIMVVIPMLAIKNRYFKQNAFVIPTFGLWIFRKRWGAVFPSSR